MITRQSIEESMAKSFNLAKEQTDVWVMVIDGKRVCSNSGKHIWNSKGAAKCALTAHRCEMSRRIEGTVLRYYNYYAKIDCSKIKPSKYARRFIPNIIKQYINEWSEKNVKIMTMAEYSKSDHH